MNLIFTFGQAFINLSAISCSTTPSGFSKITDETIVKSPVYAGQKALRGVVAEFAAIVPLDVITATEIAAIILRVEMRIVDLSLLVVVQMRTQNTA
jgi:hypothetical protein